MRVYSQCSRETGPRPIVAAQCQVNHPGMEVEPGIGGLEPQCSHDMRQSLGRLAATIERPCERVVPVDILADLEFALARSIAC